MNSFITYGKVVYDPYRPTMWTNENGGKFNPNFHKEKVKAIPKNWCVIELDNEFTSYYRWHINRYYLDGLDLIQQSHNAHISVIKGEFIKPEFKHLWKQHDGKMVAIECTMDAKLVKNEFWVTMVECDYVNVIRHELGLITGWHHHITVAKPRWM